MSTDSVLKLTDIHTYYGGSYVLQGVSLEIRERSIVALLGRNGMGKTTTIRSIIGSTPTRFGKIHFNGKDISDLPPYKIAQMGIGLIPQGRCIFPSLSVEENLVIAIRNRERSKGWSLDRVYSLFPVLKERARCRGNLLSGGEQQMLAISRALMNNPDLLLMDEPSEGLAPLIVKEVERTITQLKNDGISILLVEQHLPMALAVADYAYILSRGKVVYESTPNELRHNEEVRNRYLSAAV